MAYLFNDLVYNYKGLQLGRFDKGWIRDKRGYCAFFTENARGNGLVKPVKHVKPVKSVKNIMPLKEVRHVPVVQATERIAWSNVSGERFFMQ